MPDFAAVFMRLRAIRDPYAGRLERTVDRAWSVGDRGFLGMQDGLEVPMPGFWIAMAAAGALVAAGFARLGWIVPTGRRALTVVGAAALLDVVQEFTQDRVEALGLLQVGEVACFGEGYHAGVGRFAERRERRCRGGADALVQRRLDEQERQAGRAHGAGVVVPADVPRDL